MKAFSGLTARHYWSAVMVALFVILVTLAFVTRRPTSSTQMYRNDTYRFSLALPTDYTITEVPSTNPPTFNVPVDTIVFANAHGNIQLNILPVDDQGSTLAKEAIIHDYPYMADKPLEPVTVAPDITGFTIQVPLDSTSSINGLWFQHDGLVYQFTAFDEGPDQLAQIAGTISFF